MAKKTYFGVGNVSKAVTKAYIGIDNVARKITKIYQGVDGVAKLVYSGKKEYLYGGTSTFVLSSGNLVASKDSYSLTSDIFRIFIEKYDTVPLYIYFDNELMATFDTEGSHTFSTDSASASSIILSKGTMTITITSESNYGLGGVYFSQTWEQDAKDGAVLNYYSNMESAVFSDNVTSIHTYIFRNLVNFENLSLPSRGLVELGGYSLSGSNVTSFEIPETVTTIGNYAFYQCTSLTSVTIPESVISIGSYVFQNCTRLQSVTLPASITSINGYAFYQCTNLTSVTIADGSTVVGGFYGCTGLTSIHIPDGVRSIQSSAFGYCTGLTSIHLPDSITTISDSVFYGCTSLTSINIPDGVTSIGSSAFYGCTGLTSIYLPDSVTNIGGLLSGRTFYKCTSLTSINIPNGVTTIRESTFSGCTSLTSITIPNGVASIGKSAFQNCTSLVDITFEHSASDSLSILLDTETIANSSFYIEASDTTMATNVYHNGNESVLNYDWASCNRTVTFIQE